MNNKKDITLDELKCKVYKNEKKTIKKTKTIPNLEKYFGITFMKKEDIPTAFNNFMVIDGDDTDLRHIEPSNVIVSLYAKGKAKKDDSGFVQIKGVHYA